MKKIFYILGMIALILASTPRTNDAAAAVLVGDDAYLSYGTWDHATNTSGGHEGSATPILWRKAAGTGELFYSAYVLEMHNWHPTEPLPLTGWQGSDLYLWLNSFDGVSGFYENAFTLTEKNGLRADPDGDAGSRVTLADLYTGWEQPSRFGTATFKAGGGNVAYWLRRVYTNSTFQAWISDASGNDGPRIAALTAGVRPLIDLNLASFLFRLGGGTAGDPYELYRADERMTPNRIVANGTELRLYFDVPVAQLGSLPAPGDFTLTKNELRRRQRLGSTVGVDIPSGEPNVLRLTLSAPAVYQDAFNLTYSVPTGADGQLAGGALVVSGSERMAMGAIDHRVVVNETPPTADDVLITPSANLSAPAYRDFSADLTVSSTRPGATVVLDNVIKNPGWDSDLGVTWTGATLSIQGRPTVVGMHTLTLDITLDGMQIGATVVVEVLPQNGLADVVITPSTEEPFVLRKAADVTYTVSSTNPDAVTTLLSAVQGSGWTGNGLQFSANLSARTFRVYGTPTSAGTFPIEIRASVDGTPIDRTYDIEVVYPETNPGPGDVLVSSDLVGPIVTGRPVRFTYTVSSGIPDADIVLLDVRQGESWDDSGLSLQTNLASRQATVFGIPENPENYTLIFDVEIDGVQILGHMECFTVGSPPMASDVVHQPALPFATAYRAYRATTTVTTSLLGETLVLNGVTAGSAWIESGLSFSFDRANRQVTVEGMPTESGIYTLYLDVTVGDTRITDATVQLQVNPGDTPPSAGDIMVTPSTADPFVVNSPSTISYTVGSGIADAVVELIDVSEGGSWSGSGLRLIPQTAEKAFTVTGTPRLAGSFTLLLDVKIDGVRFEDYEYSVTVRNAPPSASDVTFTPPLPSARTHRAYEATTVLGSRGSGPVALLGVTPGTGWGGSGLSFSFDAAANSVTVAGTPTQAGTYELKLDATIGGVHVPDAVLEILVEPVGTLPAPTDVMVIPDSTKPLVVGQLARTSYTVTTGITDANVQLTGIRGGTGWNASGLDFGYVPAFRTARGTTSAAFSVFGIPQTADDFYLLLDIEIDGETILGYRVDILVVDGPPSAEDITLTPQIPSARVGRPYAASTTVGSRTGAEVVLNGVTGGVDWQESGLSFAVQGRTVTISGTPLQAGDYALYLDVSVGDARFENIAVRVTVDLDSTLPSPGELTVVPDSSAPIVVGVAADVGYRVTSGVADASVSLTAVRPGPLWDVSGLRFTYNAAANTFRVTGTPTTAGNYTLLVDADLDGTAIQGHIVNILVYPGESEPPVVQPPAVVDIIFRPYIPNAKAFRPFKATTTVGSRSGQSVALHGVTPGEEWDASGLEYAFDSRARSITISGTPEEEGVYTLLVDLTIGSTRVRNEPVVLVVDPQGSKPLPENIVIIPDRTDSLVVGRPAEIAYRVATGIEDAVLELLNVRALYGWQKSGLEFTYNLAAKTFAVSGTPLEVGSYSLLMDIRINGTLIKDFEVKIVVVEDESNGNGDGDDDGGSGGCNAGTLPLALLLPLLGTARRRR